MFKQETKPALELQNIFNSRFWFVIINMVLSSCAQTKESCPVGLNVKQTLRKKT